LVRPSRSAFCDDGHAQTLKGVKDRGSLICGVSQGLPGFSSPDDKGNWTGFDVDFCRALAAAVLNDATKVSSRRSAKDRFEPLKTGDIDVLSQLHVDALARCLLWQLRRRDLLRWSRVPGAQST
jgi:ABC-type amino acid transport substrate-binding protein